MTRLHALGLGLLLAMAAPAFSQDKAAPKPAPATAPATAAPAAPAKGPVVPAPAVVPAATTPAAASPAAKPATATSPAPAAAPVAAGTAKPAAASAAPMTAEKVDAPKKKRVTMKRKPKNTCTKLDDPWDNVCDIQKKAQLACNDLPTGKKVAKKSKKSQAPVTTENRRQQCVDNYMRNV